MQKIDAGRARGALLGQFVGDALGTTLEFKSAGEARRLYPDGLREMVGGGPFGMAPGQITDDSELALALARTLIAAGRDLDARARAYADWLRSNPPDVGIATRKVLGGWQPEVTADEMRKRALEQNGRFDHQANGALMRLCPLAVFAAPFAPGAAAELAREDARLTHPSPVCQTANAAFAVAVQVGLTGGTPEAGWKAAVALARADGRAEVVEALENTEAQPDCDGPGAGWVLLALRNAFHALRFGRSFEEALVATVMAGGDADTNGCIAGALNGAFFGEAAIPRRWIDAVHACRPNHRRPAAYQVGDGRKLADALIAAGREAAAGAGSPKPARTAPGKVLTSENSEIRVDWLSGHRLPAKVGLTIAPGKHSRAKYGNHVWRRDLGRDLDVLREKFQVGLLVCLLEDREMERLKIGRYPEEAAARGIPLFRLPIPDGGTLPDPADVAPVVRAIAEAASAGRNVVIHCQGGLGRAGTIGGCFLVSQGVDPEAALAILARDRDPNCPETAGQKQFIRDYARVRGA